MQGNNLIFHLVRPSVVEINVYDLRGMRQNFLKKSFESGTHSIPILLNPSGLSVLFQTNPKQ